MYCLIQKNFSVKSKIGGIIYGMVTDNNNFSDFYVIGSTYRKIFILCEY